MIKEKEINTLITRRNKKYYSNLGYVVDKINTEILIKISDINHNSHTKITAICELCGEETTIRLHKYYENKKRHNYYGCRKCSRKKYKKTNYEIYGVDNPMKLDEIKKKVEDSNLEKYGVKTTLLEANTLEKIHQTNLKLYGSIHVLKSKIIKDKCKKTLLKKYDCEHFSKSIYFKKILDEKWEKQILEKLKNYNIVDFKINIKDKTIDIKCHICGNYYNINSKLLYQRKLLYDSTLCTICNPLTHSFSDKESKLLNFIKQNYDGEIITNDRTILNGKEIDIYLPEIKLGIEFNGIYWHNELYKDSNYHKNKTDKCLEKNIQLLHIWEDDWVYKQDIICSMILNKIGKTRDKIYARKTEIREITDINIVREFLNKNHLQGFVGSSIKIGLYFNDDLVSLMTFGKKRKIMNNVSKENEYELLRFCNKLDTNVVGGASKIFKYFLNKYNPIEILTYADRSYSNGTLYEKLDFVFITMTQPNYSYYKNMKRYYRFNFRKDVLVKEGYDANKSEHEIMLERGYYRLYNSGNLKYVFTPSDI